MRNLFEAPKMNISMFETENVVTVASGPEPQGTTANAAAKDVLQSKSVVLADTIEFTF